MRYIYKQINTFLVNSLIKNILIKEKIMLKIFLHN